MTTDHKLQDNHKLDTLNNMVLNVLGKDTHTIPTHNILKVLTDKNDDVRGNLQVIADQLPNVRLHKVAEKNLKDDVKHLNIHVLSITSTLLVNNGVMA